MKVKRGKFLPFEFLLLLSATATVFISSLYDLGGFGIFIVFLGFLICFFSEIVFIRPTEIANNGIFEYLLAGLYIAIFSFSAVILFGLPGGELPFLISLIEAGALSLAASSLLSILFWFIASQQQTREEYLFNKEWNRGLEEYRDKMSPMSPDTWLNVD